MASPLLPSARPTQCQGPGFSLFSGFGVVGVIVIIAGALFYYAIRRRSPQYLLAEGDTRIEENMARIRCLTAKMKFERSDGEIFVSYEAGEIVHDLRSPPKDIKSLQELCALGSRLSNRYHCLFNDKQDGDEFSLQVNRWYEEVKVFEQRCKESMVAYYRHLVRKQELDEEDHRSEEQRVRQRESGRARVGPSVQGTFPQEDAPFFEV